MSLPDNYKTGLARVSQIVEWQYPFTGTDAERRFHSWLSSKGISIDSYMREASEGGTAIHLAMERLGSAETTLIKARYAPFVSSGKAFIADYKVKRVSSETYVSTQDYQGTIDLVAKIGRKSYVLDWKSYGLAKHFFGLPIPPWKKPYDKLKKAQLQLSLYAWAIGVKNIAVVELTADGYHFHVLERISKKDINSILLKFNQK